MFPNQSLGQKIRERRKDQQLTLVQVAEGSKISPSFLSQIERDQATPSVTTLYALAKTLEVSAASFFTESSTNAGAEANSFTQNSVTVVRAAQRKILISPDSNILNELLTPDLRGAIEMMLIVMPPKTDSGAESFVHVGEECGVILKGQLEIWVGEEKFILEPGDSIYYSSDIPHRSKNIGDTDVVMVVAKTSPSI